MGECLKSCCYCCASCYQSGFCLGSLCCLLVPLLGLLIILFGAVFGMMVGIGWLMQHHGEPAAVGRMLSVLVNSSASDAFIEDGRVIVE